MIELERTAHDEGAARLRTEAAVLAATDIAGLPAVVSGTAGRAGEWVLTTAVPAGVPLRDKAPFPPDEAAGIVLALAGIASDLARSGIRRNPFTAEQIHLAAGVRPTLRHLSGARSDAPSASADPGAADLGRLLHMALPPPRRHLWRLGDDAATRLRRVAHRAADPTMKLDDFASLVRQAAPGARLPRQAPRASHQRRWAAKGRSARGLAATGMAVTVAIAAAGLTLARPDGSPRPAPRRGGTATESTRPAHAGKQAAASSGGTGAMAVWPRYGCPTVEGGSRVQLEDQPCPLAGLASGTTITVGSAAWQVVGEGSYVTALGDWDCTGQTRVAALDVLTGDLWIFDGFATEAAPTQAVFAGQAPGAVGLVPPDGCGPPAALALDGSAVRLQRPEQRATRHPVDAAPPGASE